MISIEKSEEVIENWKNQILVGPLEDFELEIGEDVPREHAVIALFLDLSTVKAAGNTQEFYDGYSKAAQDLLRFLGIELFQDDTQKKVYIQRSRAFQETQERLKEFIWGDGS